MSSPSLPKAQYEAVRDFYFTRPFYWDPNHVDYKNTTRRSHELSQFATAMGVEPCSITTWLQNQRTQYVAYRKQDKQRKEEGKALISSPWKDWNLAKMAFLADHIKSRKPKQYTASVSTQTEQPINLVPGLEANFKGLESILMRLNNADRDQWIAVALSSLETFPSSQPDDIMIAATPIGSDFVNMTASSPMGANFDPIIAHGLSSTDIDIELADSDVDMPLQSHATLDYPHDYESVPTSCETDFHYDQFVSEHDQYEPSPTSLTINNVNWSCSKDSKDLEDALTTIDTGPLAWRLL